MTHSGYVSQGRRAVLEEVYSAGCPSRGSCRVQQLFSSACAHPSVIARNLSGAVDERLRRSTILLLFHHCPCLVSSVCVCAPSQRTSRFASLRPGVTREGVYRKYQRVTIAGSWMCPCAPRHFDEAGMKFLPSVASTGYVHRMAD